MMRFKYRAKNDRGDIVGGVVRADNVLAAEKILRTNNLVTIDIFPETNEVFSLFRIRRKISLRDKAIFSSQLSTMVSAGLSLPKSISIIAAQTENQYLKSIFYNVNRDLEEGLNFSSSLAKYPDVFDELFINIVRSGESTGNLETVMLRMSEKIDKDQSLSAKLFSAMIYPMFIIIALIAVGWLLLVKIVPQIESVFKDANAQLPWATSFLIAISHILSAYWWVILLVLLLIIFFARYFLATTQGKSFYAKLQISIPGFKKVSSDVYMARFCRTIQMLFESGVPLLESINITSNVMINGYYKNSLQRISKEVQKGVSFSVELSKDSLYPPLVSQMMAVGEQTGKSAEVLEKLAKFYEDEAENAIRGVYSLVEPLAMVLVGIGVAVLVFAILVPIYQIAQLQ
ncbi:MAG: type II secretion system F family protein [Candidatus Berkelbacteria bacterium]|nr:type II secretion system F family protein [Candidatus Berkelbacteria bacterium]